MVEGIYCEGCQRCNNDMIKRSVCSQWGLLAQVVEREDLGDHEPKIAQVDPETFVQNMRSIREHMMRTAGMSPIEFERAFSNI